ncbi:MAG: lipopolysaccharide biosynthesis protein [Desertimonas sp.]
MAASQGADVRPETPRTRSRHGWVLSTGVTLTLGIAALVTAPMAARILGPEGRGRLVSLQVLPQLVAELAAIGLPFAMVHYGARQPRTIATLLRWSVKPALIGSVAMIALGQALASTVTGGIDADTDVVRIYLLLCPVVAFTTLAQETFRSTGGYVAWSVLALARGLAWPAALVVGLARQDPDPHLVVWTHLALTAVVMVVAVAWAHRRFGADRDEPDTTRKEFVAYGVHSVTSTIPRTASARIDQVLMSALVSRSDVGLYAAAVGWGMITIPAMRGLSNVTMPLVSSAKPHQVADRVRLVITAGVVMGLAVSLGAIPATLLLWGPIYGAEFAPALGAAVVMVPAAILLELGLVLGNVLRSLGRPLQVTRLEVAMMVLATAGVLAVLPLSTVLGPALASFGVYLIAVVIYIRDIAATVGRPARSLIAPRRLGALVHRAPSPASG